MAEKVSFEETDLVPLYVNNARIEVTDENVFVDFGLADPFDVEQDVDVVTSQVQARVVMNKSTFLTLAEHINKLSAEIEEKPHAQITNTLMSRCPPGDD